MSELSRRHFLLAAAVAAPAATLGATPAFAVDRHQLFTDAAARHGVPAAVLAAVSYHQSRWLDHEGRPSTSLGYGPMHLIDGAAAQQHRERAMGQVGARVVDTLGRAAKLTGHSEAGLRTDPGRNIDGAAAVMADAQHRLGLPTGTETDPADWYATIALTSGLTAATAQRDFADDVVETLRSGVTQTEGKDQLRLAPQQVGSPAQQRAVVQARAARRNRGPVDAPKGLGVEWLAAPYEKTGPEPGDYGNHDLANRPTSPVLNTIVVHNTEASFDTCMDLVTDPNYVAWNYTLRSSDGHIVQHLQTQDVGWHAGNWYVNSHSIGFEHEGYSAAGASWFSEPMYRRSARLLRYLAAKYDIPLDRGHVIGHDQVPAVTSARIPAMHTDPGPFWNWERYFNLLGAPLHRGTVNRRPRVGDALRILPGFAKNRQVITGCDHNKPPICQTPGAKPANFVPLHVQPNDGAPLVNDIGLHPKGEPSTTHITDTGPRATAGTDYVCAGVQGEWTAIWFLGQRAWFRNPRQDPTARVLSSATIAYVDAPAATFGVCYPDQSAPGAAGVVPELSPLVYELPAGQAYVVFDADPPTNYYKAKTYDIATPGDHVDIVGEPRYVGIYLGHRLAYLRADSVRVE